MENPLSVRANAFAIASIMSDPEAAALADTAAMLQAYGYCPPGLGGTSAVLPPHHRHHGGLVGGGQSASSLQLNQGICRSVASTGSDCRFQIDWTSTAGSTTTNAASASGGSSMLHQQLPHHQQQGNGSAAASADIGEYSSGLKGMEGQYICGNLRRERIYSFPTKYADPLRTDRAVYRYRMGCATCVAQMSRDRWGEGIVFSTCCITGGQNDIYILRHCVRNQSKTKPAPMRICRTFFSKQGC